MAYLSTVPMATKSLGYLEDLANVRLAAHERVCKLHGKLEMLLAQVRGGVTVVTATTGEYKSLRLIPIDFVFVFCMSILTDVSATELQRFL